MSDGKFNQAQEEQAKTPSTKTKKKGSSQKRVVIAAAVVVICAVIAGIVAWRGDDAHGTRPPEPVSYTHLTLPTIYSV